MPGSVQDTKAILNRLDEIIAELSSFSTQRKSPREAEEERLRAEASGALFAPVPRGSFFLADRRENLIEQHVAKGLEKFDQEQQERNQTIYHNGRMRLAAHTMP